MATIDILFYVIAYIKSMVWNVKKRNECGNFGDCPDIRETLELNLPTLGHARDITPRPQKSGSMMLYQPK